MSRRQIPDLRSCAGFTLIWMSIILTVGAMIFASVLPGQEAGNNNQKNVTSSKKLETVEAAMRAFMAFNGRRPCPADGQYAVNTANFGIEAATPGTCTGGTPTALGPDSGTSRVVMGTIPTKTLGLPDDYAFDAWGRRFTYVVDVQATLKSSCMTLQNYPTNNGVGSIKIESASNVTPELDDVMYAYISHGPDGHGAWPGSGGSGGLTAAQSAALRLNAGSRDADENNNAAASSDGLMTYSTSNLKNYFVQKEKTATFDDLVWYRPDIKNTCCLGTAACVSNYPGIRIDGVVASGGGGLSGVGMPNGIRHGHIHDKTLNDLVISAPTAAGGGVYVIFGRSSSFPSNHYTLDNNATTGLIDGTHGFHLYDSSDNSYGNNHNNYNGYQGSIAVGDVNGDGYDDIIMCNGPGTCDIYYGGNASTWSTGTVNMHTLGYSTCVSTWVKDGNGQQFGDSLAVADIDQDGNNDLIVGDDGLSICAPATLNGTFTFTGTQQTNGKTIKLGSPSTQTWTFTTGAAGNNKTVIQGTAAATLTQLAADLNSASNGGLNSKINVATYSADATHLYVAYNATNCTTYSLSASTAASAVSASTLTPTTTAYGEVFVLFGLPYASHCGAGTQVEPIPPGTNLTTLTSATTPRGVTILGPTTSSNVGAYMGVGDVNGDGYPDIIINDNGDDRVLIIAGQPTGGWPNTINSANLTGIPNFNTTNPVCSLTAGAGSTDNRATCGTVITSTGDCQANVSTGDVTGDGVADILIGWDACNNGSLQGSILVKGGAGNFTASSYNVTPSGTAGTMLNLGTAYSYHPGGEGIGGSGYQEPVGSMIGNVHVKNGTTGDILFPVTGYGTTNPSPYGSVFVLFGGASLLTGTSVHLDTTPPSPPTTGFRIDCPYATTGGASPGGGTDTCGYSLDQVDLNGDGIPDIVIAVPSGNVTGSNQEGYIYVLYGKTSGWSNPTALSTIY